MGSNTSGALELISSLSFFDNPEITLISASPWIDLCMLVEHYLEQHGLDQPDLDHVTEECSISDQPLTLPKMKRMTFRSATLYAGLLLAIFSHAQVVQNFLFAGQDVALSSFNDPCQAVSDITVTTTDANSTNEVHHSLFQNALWIPSSGDNDPATEVLVTITFNPPVESPRLSVGDLDYLEWYHGFSPGFTGIDPSTGVHFVDGIVRTIAPLYSYDWSCTLNWEGCQESISFIYHRPTDLNIVLHQVTYTVCAQPPPATTELEFYMNTDANSDDVHWEIRRAGCSDPVCAGEGYANSSACQIETCFLEDGDYVLEVFNEDGDDFTGQYMLRSVNDGRIVDSPDGFDPASNLLHGGTGEFSLPMGTTRMQENLLDNLHVLDNSQPAFRTNNYTGLASAVVWMVFDADGGMPVYITGFIVSGQALYDLVTAGTLVNDKVYNVRARSATGTGSIGYGPATTFMIPTADYHTNATLCLPSRLVDNPNVNPPGEHSCNVERTASGQVWAPYRAGYRHFRYIWTPLDQQTSDDLIITRTNSNPQVSRILPLSGTATNTTYFIGQGTSTPGAAPASYGLGAWMVRVQTRRDAYNPWCDLGECCRVTIIEGFQDPPGEKNIELTGAQQPLIWPNPNRGRQLFMDLTWAKAKTVRVEVLDVFGRLVQDQQLAPQEGIPNSIQVRDRMSAGTYMVRITDGNEVRTTRLVISQ